MTLHRFKLELAGQTVYGLAFETEAELEQFCASRGGLQVAQPAAPADPPTAEPRARGRPSFDSMIAAAVKELELDDRESLPVRARQVLQHLALAHGSEDIPCRRTVTRYLTAQPIGQKSGQNHGQNSRRARIRRTGGI